MTLRDEYSAYTQIKRVGPPLPYEQWLEDRVITLAQLVWDLLGVAPAEAS
jgi:hypothetical protein